MPPIGSTLVTSNFATLGICADGLFSKTASSFACCGCNIPLLRLMIPSCKASPNVSI